MGGIQTKKNNKNLMRTINAVMQQWEIHTVIQNEKTKYCEDVLSLKVNCYV